MPSSSIKIYSTNYCPYCVRAKKLLADKGLVYEEIDVNTPELRAELVKKSGGLRTVPQIFIGDRHIGGYDKLYALNLSGELDKILKD